MGMIFISRSTNLLALILSFEMKKRLLMILCLSLSLASQKERRQKLIIFHVQNTIFSEFLLFSFHSLCWMQDA